MRADKGAILPGQANRLAAKTVDQVDDILVDLAQHHLHHVHGFFVGDAHALHKFAGLAYTLEQIIDLRAAAVHYHRIHTDQLEQHNIPSEAFLQLGIGHRIAAVFDHDGFIKKTLDIRHRLGKGMCLLCGGGSGECHSAFLNKTVVHFTA